MFPVALLLAGGAIAADPALVARADELNERYTQCLFAVSRDAQERAIPEDRFPALLAASCEGERDQMHQVFVAVQVQRGNPQAKAEAAWQRVESEGRAGVERAYRIGRRLSQ